MAYDIKYYLQKLYTAVRQSQTSVKDHHNHLAKITLLFSLILLIPKPPSWQA